jgi:fibronectin type 3 domain-containing protein
MKKLILILSTLSLLLLSGCGPAVKNAMIHNTDYSLNGLNKVKVLPMRNYVGFEWPTITDSRVHGVNIYRSVPTTGNQTFERIGSTNSRFATHFVDTRVQANVHYLYTFTTFMIGKESKYGVILNVKTLPHLEAVSFAKAFIVAPATVKLLWAPHSNQGVIGYRIERSVGNGPWKYLTEVRGQLMAEYVDTFVRQGQSYHYRVFAKSYDRLLSYPSTRMSISL